MVPMWPSVTIAVMYLIGMKISFNKEHKTLTYTPSKGN
ncbi:hypothetical protein UFOVP787_73 [uncultured Caudovirales phage]|uniref:Uncharacterized protein n=1 Tax=uncultured Caudovirales phage TaxID=2100421 RepID=A0A6J5NTA8_9CAUD|nr:hypothetical protein UFOVP787_73 [uncultured Caudovirales phage]